MAISGTLTPSENDLGTTNCDILKRISFLAATEPMLLKIKHKTIMWVADLQHQLNSQPHFLMRKLGH